jgi:hypothetical protein
MNSVRSPFSPDQAGNSLASTSVSRDPLADVWIAIHQYNALCLALSKKRHAILTGQSQLLQVKTDATIFSFGGDERFQLGNVFLLDPAAKGKDWVPVRFLADS